MSQPLVLLLLLLWPQVGAILRPAPSTLATTLAPRLLSLCNATHCTCLRHVLTRNSHQHPALANPLYCRFAQRQCLFFSSPLPHVCPDSPLVSRSHRATPLFPPLRWVCHLNPSSRSLQYHQGLYL